MSAKETTTNEDDLGNLDEFVEQEEDEELLEAEKKEELKGSYAGVQACSFRDMLLKAELQRAIGDCGFEHPSEVQQNAIPFAMVGTDMIVQAKSGMGKTAVFVISTLQQIEAEEENKSVDTLVLCHCRELAFQICSEYQRFSKYLTNVKVEVVYGGIPVSEHKKMLKENCPHVLIGTPGRILHLLNDGDLKLENLKRFILDECDELLDSGLDMRRQIQEIFKKTPFDKQTMLYSATYSETARKLAKKFTRKAEEIFIDNKKLVLHGLQQHFVQLEETEKMKKLVDLLDAVDFNQVVIFVKTKQRATALDKVLRKSAFPSLCIHSNLKQKERIERYKQFKAYKHRILVSTNLWGRGVDIERVNVVLNFDMPIQADEYLHRVGRAGRFGTKGLAISFVVKDDENDTKILEEVQDRFKVKITPLPQEIDSSTYMAK